MSSRLKEAALTWEVTTVLALYEKPFMDLIYQAQKVHRHYFPKRAMQLSTLLNVKTGGCPEDCHYCPQAARYHTGVKAEKLMTATEVRQQAQYAKEAGATRFCMGAAWRELKDRDMPKMVKLVQTVKELGLETCDFGNANSGTSSHLEGSRFRFLQSQFRYFSRILF